MAKKFDDALKFAISAHSGQVRKMGKLPFILHPMEVATIVGTITDDDDILCAAVLHDIVEDTPVEMKDVQRLFGDNVARMIASETENKRKDLPMTETWKIRKQETLDHLKTASIDEKILWLGDKLSNLRSIYRTWLKVGDEVFNNFHQKDKSQHEWYYRTIAEYLGVLGEHEAYNEYSNIIKIIFGEEK